MFAFERDSNHCILDSHAAVSLQEIMHFLSSIDV